MLHNLHVKERNLMSAVSDSGAYIFNKIRKSNNNLLQRKY